MEVGPVPIVNVAVRVMRRWVVCTAKCQCTRSSSWWWLVCLNVGVSGTEKKFRRSLRASWKGERPSPPWRPYESRRCWLRKRYCKLNTFLMAACLHQGVKTRIEMCLFQARKVKRKLIFKRAEKYHKEYRQMYRREIRLSRIARRVGNFYVPAEPKLAFVIRIRG